MRLNDIKTRPNHHYHGAEIILTNRCEIDGDTAAIFLVRRNGNVFPMLIDAEDLDRISRQITRISLPDVVWAAARLIAEVMVAQIWRSTSGLGRQRQSGREGLIAHTRSAFRLEARMAQAVLLCVLHCGRTA